MKIFDQRFLKYQLAALKHNKYKNSILYLNIFLIAIGGYNRANIGILVLCIGAVAFLIGYGYLRFNKETGLSEEAFQEVMNKKYEEYENASQKADSDAGLRLQKIAFAAELDKVTPENALKEIKELTKKNPEIKKFANNIILSLYAYQWKDKSKIPQEYIDYLDKTVKKEVNVNLLSDCIKTCILLEEYNKVLSIVNKAEEELSKVKKIRKPAYNAIYRTMLVSLPFYKGEAYQALGNKKKAKESFEQALKNCKSKNFKLLIENTIEKL